jgi:curved DNA-binding protein CbpA
MTRRRWHAPAADPFTVLGLAPSPGLSDDDVRTAWRRAASNTHPDRDDGGDPQRFAAAAAAYTALRTRSGRGEALADLGPAPPPALKAGSRRSARAGQPRLLRAVAQHDPSRRMGRHG